MPAGCRTLPVRLRSNDLDGMNLAADTNDFTVHMEPDWENDIQTSLLSFRHDGRLVAKIAPSSVEAALDALQVKSMTFEDMEPGLKRTAFLQNTGAFWHHKVESRLGAVIETPLVNFHGGMVARSEDSSTAILVPTVGLPKARACILGMYSLYYANKSSWQDSADFAPVTTTADLLRAFERNARHMIGTELAPTRFLAQANEKSSDLDGVQQLQGELLATQPDRGARDALDEERARGKPPQVARKMSL
ncbi:hypothetical protein LTR08_005281 [Meristemomyces frigidus]|nr:hypothetical protein LTR08_005281 [Meristemomyces frigidus]